MQFLWLVPILVAIVLLLIFKVRSKKQNEQATNTRNVKVYWVIIVAFAVLLLPNFVDFLFWLGDYLSFTISSSFSEADILAYIGAILGFGAAIFAVYKAIQYENEKQRLEDTRRENDRKREESEKRMTFLTGLFEGAKRNLNFSKFFNRSRELSLFINDPGALYNQYEATSMITIIDANLSDNEKIVVIDELKNLKEYAQECSMLFWSYYDLVVSYNGANKVIELNERMMMLAIERMKRNVENPNLTQSEYNQKIADFYEAERDYEDSVKVSRKIISEVHSSIPQIKSELEKLYSEKYSILPTLVSSILQKLDELHKSQLNEVTP